MLRHARAIVRLVLILTLTAVHVFLFALGLPFSFLFRNGFLRWRIRASCSWARGIALLIGLRLRTRGNRPEPPFFLVTNHLSYVDIWVLESLVRGFFVAKSEVARWPLAGQVVQCGNAIFIEQSRKTDIPRVLEVIQRILDSGLGVILFPEAEAGSGEELLPFRAPVLEVAARGGLPVSYAAISYETPPDEPPASAAVHWWGPMRLPGHLYRLLQVRRVYATVTFGDETVKDDDRKVLASRLWDRVNALLEPTRSESHT